MTKQDIIDYVMITPSNPNKAVLEGMLDSVAEASQGGGGVPTLTLYVTDSGTASASYYITEEDANKVFGEYPIGFKSRVVANGEASPLIKAFLLDSLGEDGGRYKSLDGQVMAFQFENVITMSDSQGGDLNLAWDATSRRYKKDADK